MADCKRTDIYIVAGEASGDLHAANLVKALKAADPGITVRGFGGTRLKESGCEFALDLTEFAVMGIKKVLPLIGRFIDVINLFRYELKTCRPKVVVLIDYPGLNFILARAAKSLGIPVVYYCCPQLWAWAPWRAKKIKRLAKLLLLIFPFEEDFFSGGKAEARYVGHPLCDELSKIDRRKARESVRTEFGIKKDELLVGLFPGSRRQEVVGLGKIMHGVADRLSGRHNNVKFVFSCLKKEYVSLLPEGMSWPVLEGPGEPLMAACDLGLVASGTASLELAFFGKPMVVVYPLTWWKRKLYHMLSTSPFICSTNLLAGKELVPEYFVSEKSDEIDKVTDRIEQYIVNEKERKACCEALEMIGKTYLGSGASIRAAEAILEECGNP